MKIYTINARVRKKSNVAVLLDSFEAGIKAVESEAEIIRVNLYELTFKGCRECFLCKLKNGKSYGECGFRDGAFELVHGVSHADGFALGSPVFFGDLGAEAKEKWHRKQYPKDCKKAYDIGQKMAEELKSETEQ